MTDTRTTTYFYPTYDLAICAGANTAVEHIAVIYERSVQAIHDRFHAFVRGEDCSEGLAACYPYLGITVDPKTLVSDARSVWGTVAYPDVYGTMLTRPDLFRDYYRMQIERPLYYHNSLVVAGVGDRPIPLPSVVEVSTMDIMPEQARALGGAFTLPDLVRTDDFIANGTYRLAGDEPQPLSMSTAERVDLALQRLYHYAATYSRHFQRFILFTNCQHYADESAALGRELMGGGNDGGHIHFVEPGDMEHDLGMPVSDDSHHIKGLPQMPVYHLAHEDCLGATLANIGVGPSNARTTTDHLTVLRPYYWVVIGHCSGLRRSQRLGDYVLARAYVRDDHALDQDLPPWVPVPSVAEIQVALQEAVTHVTGLPGVGMKPRMRIGTAVSTDDHNWELKHQALYSRFNQSRATATDMGSATIIINGFRLRVPYGTPLCASSKPLHGELELYGMANPFYRQRISQHLDISVEAVRLLRESGVEVLHLHKLRSFDEPASRQCGSVQLNAGAPPAVLRSTGARALSRHRV